MTNQERISIHVKQAERMVKDVMEDHRLSGTPQEYINAMLSGFLAGVIEEYRVNFNGNDLILAQFLYSVADFYGTRPEVKEQLKIPEYKNVIKNQNPPKKEAA